MVQRCWARVECGANSVTIAVRATLDSILFGTFHQDWTLSTAHNTYSVRTQVRFAVGTRGCGWHGVYGAPCRRHCTQPIGTTEGLVHWAQVRTLKSWNNFHVQSHFGRDAGAVIVRLADTVMTSDVTRRLATIGLGCSTSRFRGIAATICRAPASVQAKECPIRAGVGSRTHPDIPHTASIRRAFDWSIVRTAIELGTSTRIKRAGTIITKVWRMQRAEQGTAPNRRSATTRAIHTQGRLVWAASGCCVWT